MLKILHDMSEPSEKRLNSYINEYCFKYYLSITEYYKILIYQHDL